MKKIAQFKKISFKQYQLDYQTFFKENSQNHSYDSIKQPKRATTGSAGYDFFSPESFKLAPKESIIILTGIRVKMETGWVLKLYPRSSLGFKYSIQLSNTVGIIDSDYYNTENEGHILIKLTNYSQENKTLEIKSGEAFAQGIFLEYGITYDDQTTKKRIGGIGSTNQ